METVENGIRGVQMALDWQPDVAVTDIGHPGCDGFAVARHLRSALGESICLIAVTAYTGIEFERRANGWASTPSCPSGPTRASLCGGAALDSAVGLAIAENGPAVEEGDGRFRREAVAAIIPLRPALGTPCAFHFSTNADPETVREADVEYLRSYRRWKRDRLSGMGIRQLRELVPAAVLAAFDQTFAEDWAKAAACRLVLRGSTPAAAVQRVWQAVIHHPEGRDLTILAENPFGL